MSTNTAATAVTNCSINTLSNLNNGCSLDNCSPSLNANCPMNRLSASKNDKLLLNGVLELNEKLNLLASTDSSSSLFIYTNTNSLANNSAHKNSNLSTNSYKCSKSNLDENMLTVKLRMQKWNEIAENSCKKTENFKKTKIKFKDALNDKQSNSLTKLLNNFQGQNDIQKFGIQSNRDLLDNDKTKQTGQNDLEQIVEYVDQYELESNSNLEKNSKKNSIIPLEPDYNLGLLNLDYKSTKTSNSSNYSFNLIKPNSHDSNINQRINRFSQINKFNQENGLRTLDQQVIDGQFTSNNDHRFNHLNNDEQNLNQNDVEILKTTNSILEFRTDHHQLINRPRNVKNFKRSVSDLSNVILRKSSLLFEKRQEQSINPFRFNLEQKSNASGKFRVLNKTLKVF